MHCCKSKNKQHANELADDIGQDILILNLNAFEPEQFQADTSHHSDEDCHCSNPFCCLKQAPIYFDWFTQNNRNITDVFKSKVLMNTPSFNDRQFSEIWHPPI